MGSPPGIDSASSGLVVHMSAPLRERAISISRAMLPNEACGLLGGHRNGDKVEVVSVHSVANSLGSPRAFALDGLGMINAEDEVEAAGQEVVGIFHSHPATAAVPSLRDLDDAHRYDPFAVMIHLIVSMQGFAPQLRVYRYADLAPVELSLETT